jgi:hypothetical protein
MESSGVTASLRECDQLLLLSFGTRMFLTKRAMPSFELSRVAFALEEEKTIAR